MARAAAYGKIADRIVNPKKSRYFNLEQKSIESRGSVGEQLKA